MQKKIKISLAFVALSLLPGDLVMALPTKGKSGHTSSRRCTSGRAVAGTAFALAATAALLASGGKPVLDVEAPRVLMMDSGIEDIPPFPVCHLGDTSDRSCDEAEAAWYQAVSRVKAGKGYALGRTSGVFGKFEDDIETLNVYRLRCEQDINNRRDAEGRMCPHDRMSERGEVCSQIKDLGDDYLYGICCAKDSRENLRNDRINDTPSACVRKGGISEDKVMELRAQTRRNEQAKLARYARDAKVRSRT